MPCKCCGVEGPTKDVRFQQNIGLLFSRQTATMEGELCRPCIGRVFRSYTLTTLFLGWWGMISMIMTPIFLISNVAQYLGALRLPEPGISAMATTPYGLTSPPVASGSFKFKMIYGAIICCFALGILAYNRVALMEKIAPGINAKLHSGAITDEAGGEYSGVQVGKDIKALEADIKSDKWEGIRSELLARESYLQDLDAQNTRIQDLLQQQRSANLGANDPCENLFLTEFGPALNDYTTAQNNMFSFIKSNPKLTDESQTAVQLLSDRQTSAEKELSDYYAHSDTRHCDK